MRLCTLHFYSFSYIRNNTVITFVLHWLQGLPKFSSDVLLFEDNSSNNWVFACKCRVPLIQDSRLLVSEGCNGVLVQIGAIQTHFSECQRSVLAGKD